LIPISPANSYTQHKTLDVITLFHKPSLATSTRVATLIKQASAHASEAATEDQASNHSHQNKFTQREPFELDITEEAPTPDQLRSILEYVGPGKLSQLVKGANSESDAMRKIKENADSFQRPVVSEQFFRISRRPVTWLKMQLNDQMKPYLQHLYLGGGLEPGQGRCVELA
jgi:Protein of unknown function (DUF1687)